MEEKNRNGIPAVGIPRALLYYRYGAMWEQFFRFLDVPVILSPPGSRGILEAGTRLAPDESCLALKMFIGHVDTLIGRCRQVFIPRYSNYGYTDLFCPRYEGLYDQARNIFRSSVKSLWQSSSSNNINIPGILFTKVPGMFFILQQVAVILCSQTGQSGQH